MRRWTMPLRDSAPNRDRLCITVVRAESEHLGQIVDHHATFVRRQQLSEFLVVEPPLELPRSGSSSGWMVALRTSENASKRGHVVVVGVTAHQLHWPRGRALNSRSPLVASRIECPIARPTLAALLEPRADIASRPSRELAATANAYPITALRGRARDHYCGFGSGVLARRATVSMASRCAVTCPPWSSTRWRM